MPLYYQDDNVTLYHGDCLWEHREWLSADVLVTDPPYGIDWAQNSMHYTRTVKATKSAVANDENTDARDDVLAAWGKRPAVVFGSWRKPRPTGTQHRLIWHKLKTKTTHEARSGGDGLSAQVGHPTPKPVPLMEMLIEKCPTGVITDPFAGSGATLIAARNLGRKVIGVELEERYCEIIAKRCAQDVLDLGVTA